MGPICSMCNMEQVGSWEGRSQQERSFRFGTAKDSVPRIPRNWGDRFWYLATGICNVASIGGMTLPTRPIIAPSILAANYAALGEDIAKVDNAGWIHVDIMDGHFVPNLSFGADVTKAVNEVTDQILDVHLMIEEPEKWVDNYIEAGADCVIFHVEATDDPRPLLVALREKGVRAGFSVKPGTPIEDYLDLVDIADLVLVMSVEPGFGGQSFMADMLPKIRGISALIKEYRPACELEVDGGVDPVTCKTCIAAGANVLVAGSAVYKADDIPARIAELRG